MGEPNIPIDRAFMAAPGFYELLARLKRHAEENQRDHWCALHKTRPWACMRPHHEHHLLELCLSCLMQQRSSAGPACTRLECLTQPLPAHLVSSHMP